MEVDCPSDQVVQKINDAIHQISHYPVKKFWGNNVRYLVERDFLMDGVNYL